MKMTKSNFATLGGGLILASLAFVSVAQSQNYGARHGSVVASMDSRSAFATGMENQLRQRGIDARVQLAGDARDVLHVEWTSVRRNDIFSFVNSTVVDNAKQIGFATVVFTDGRQRWDYNVARESMVWSPAQ
jgi:hypothetical protein